MIVFYILITKSKKKKKRLIYLNPWKSSKHGRFWQNQMSQAIWHRPYVVMGIFDGTKFQGPLGMSPWTFRLGPNILQTLILILPFVFRWAFPFLSRCLPSVIICQEDGAWYFSAMHWGMHHSFAKSWCQNSYLRIALNDLVKQIKFEPTECPLKTNSCLWLSSVEQMWHIYMIIKIRDIIH